MQNFEESILASRFSKDLGWDFILSASGVLLQHPLPGIELGRMWRKQAKNGRLYYKIKFDCFMTAAGKPLYARAWVRKLEPDVFDVYAHLNDNELPLRRRPRYFG